MATYIVRVKDEDEESLNGKDFDLLYDLLEKYNQIENVAYTGSRGIVFPSYKDLVELAKTSKYAAEIHMHPANETDWRPRMRPEEFEHTKRAYAQLEPIVRQILSLKPSKEDLKKISLTSSDLHDAVRTFIQYLIFMHKI